MAPSPACPVPLHRDWHYTKQSRILACANLVLILFMFSLINSVKFHSSAKVNQTGLINKKPTWPGEVLGLWALLARWS